MLAKNIICLVAFICAFTVGRYVFASDASDEQRRIDDLITFKNEKNTDAEPGDALHLREGAIREAAVTVGIQGGIRYRYELINQEISRVASKLDFIYNFRPLLINEKMLPPIIAESNGTFGLEEDGSASSSLATYEIIQDAKLVATAPQWRDYLIHDYQSNADINPALKPKSDIEREAWSRGVSEGWAEGIQIADRMAIEHINRLGRDYQGVIRFHRLAQQGVLSMPTLSIGDLGVHVNGKKLDINQRIFRITQPSMYQEKPSDWRIIRNKQIESETERND